MADIVERTAAAMQFLNALKGTPSYPAAVTKQMAAMKVALSKMPCTPSDGVKMLEVLKDLPQADYEDICEHIAERSCPPEAPVQQGRQQVQDYTSMCSYFTEAHWKVFLDPNVHDSRKIDMTFEHLVSLGLRSASEPTCQVMAAVLLHTVESREKVEQMTSTVKFEFMRAIKAKLKAFIGRLVEKPQGHISKLPDSPEEFKKLHPQAFSCAFKDSWPQSPPISTLDLQRMQASIPMRASRGDAKASGRPAAQISLTSNAFETQATQLASCMMQQMQQMQQMMAQSAQQQQSFMMQMLGQSGSKALPDNAPGLNAPSSAAGVLALTAAVSTLPAHAAALNNRTLTKLQSRLDLVAGAEECRVPEAALTSVEASAVAAAPSVPVPVLAQPPVPAKPKKLSVQEATDAMLQAMGDKKEESKEAKRQRPSAAESETPKPSKKAKTNKAAAASPKTGQKTKALAKAVTKSPSYGIESTRCQYMGRTGLTGPQQTKAFKYKNGDAKSKAAALKAVEAWVKEQKKARGLQ